MYCELCGAESDELLVVSIESARMQVCGSCKPQGKLLGVVSDHRAVEPAVNEPATPSVLPEAEVDFVEAPERVVRSARAAKGWTQEELAQKIAEPVSVIRKVEAGKAEPTEKVARKLEKALGVALLKGKEEKPLAPQKLRKAGESITLGDVIVIKSK